MIFNKRQSEQIIHSQCEVSKGFTEIMRMAKTHEDIELVKRVWAESDMIGRTIDDALLGRE